MKRIVIIGATSRIAEHCARLWVKESIDLVLVGRDQAKLDAVALDLQVRSPRSIIKNRIASFEDPTKIKEVVLELSKIPVDIALIAHGHLPEQKECQINLALNKDTLDINGISPVLFAESFATEMERQNKGCILVIGSVAGDRGRKTNYVYGAAKGMVARYVQGLQHRLAKTDVKVFLIKPGPTDTPMIRSEKNKNLSLADPNDVAMKIVESVYKKRSCCVYVPFKWWWIMLLIQHLPKKIFNKLEI